MNDRTTYSTWMFCFLAGGLAGATVRDGGGAPGVVVDGAGRGYLWNDELLRPARVGVAE